MSKIKRRIGSPRLWIAISILTVIFLPPFVKYQELRYKNAKLEERINYLQRDNERLADEKRKLETDINYVEKRSREKIGVVRKGEIVLKEVKP
jgi:cell division protein FtsB